MANYGRRSSDMSNLEIPFLGGAYEGRSKSINAQRSINLFPVIDQQDGKTTIAMYGTPGAVAFSSPATSAVVRGLHIMGSYLYAVVGATVYEIAANGTASLLGRAFTALSQTTRNWTGMAAAPNGNVYACVYGGDIYMQTGGAGNFVALGQNTVGWWFMAVSTGGDVYAVELSSLNMPLSSTDVYKQTGGTGDFVNTNQEDRVWLGITHGGDGAIYADVNYGDIYLMAPTSDGFLEYGRVSRLWTGLAVAPNWDILASAQESGIYSYDSEGRVTPVDQTARYWYSLAVTLGGDIYACVYNGDIYRQTGGAGAFSALGQTSRAWMGLAAAPNGDIYACTYGGDIYMQTAGTGDFMALSQTSRVWYDVAVAPNGNVYACVYNGDIYMQTGGAGAFTTLGQTARNWTGLATAPNGDVYAVVDFGGIYKQIGGVGDFTVFNSTSRRWRDVVMAVNGDLYFCVFGGSLYKLASGTSELEELTNILTLSAQFSGVSSVFNIYDEYGNVNVNWLAELGGHPPVAVPLFDESKMVAPVWNEYFLKLIKSYGDL